MSGPLAEGELVVVHDRAGRRYQVRLQNGSTFSIHSGAVPHDELIGLPEGSLVTTALGARLLVLRPTLADRVVLRRRSAQPIYPKDLGAVLMHADIHPGAAVLEAGIGTGALTLALLRSVGPAGRVVSYEVREDFLEAGSAAVAEALGGIPSNLSLKLGDVYEALDEPPASFDRACLDLPEPWRAVAAFARGLRPGGVLFAISPNISQVERFVEGLRSHGGFGLMETVEVLERAWTVRGRSLRPNHRMVAHSGFLTFARRLAGEAVFETDSEGFQR